MDSLSGTKTLLYPPLERDLFPKQGHVRMGVHTDARTVSFIFQDNTGGLEVMHSEDNIVQAIPIPVTVLVMVGSLLQRWTADFLQAADHRVPIPTDEERLKTARQSLVFFLSPDEDYIINCLDGSGKNDPITQRDYLKFRLAEIYGK